MPEGGELTIQADARAGRASCLSLIDTGKGMSPEVLAKVFRPFFSTRSRRHRPGPADDAQDRRGPRRHASTCRARSAAAPSSPFACPLRRCSAQRATPQALQRTDDPWNRSRTSTASRCRWPRSKVSALDRGFLFGDARLRGAARLPGQAVAGGRALRAAWRAAWTPSASAAWTSTACGSGCTRPSPPAASARRSSTSRSRAAPPRARTPFPAGATPLEFLCVQEFGDPYAERAQRRRAVITAAGHPLGPLRHQIDQPAGQRAGHAGGQGGRLPRGAALPARRHPDRGDAHQLLRRAATAAC